MNNIEPKAGDFVIVNFDIYNDKFTVKKLRNSSKKQKWFIFSILRLVNWKTLKCMLVNYQKRNKRIK